MNDTKWIFPKDINLYSVPEYMKKIDKINTKHTFIFDLIETEKIHSSFIGFLIFVKEKIENGGGRLILKISPSLQKTLNMMNIKDYFSSATDDIHQSIEYSSVEAQ